MAEPKLQIEQRLDNIEEAVRTLANLLTETQMGFEPEDADEIDKILRGEKTEKTEEADAST